MPFEGVSGLVWLILFFVAVLLIALTVTVIGGVLVALVSLPLLYLLPTVRDHLITLAEEVFSVQIDSLGNWRFITTYVLFIEFYGFSLLILFASLIESLPAVAERIPPGAVDLPPLLALGGLLGAGLFLGIHRAASKDWFRAVVEWMVFLGLLAVLTVIAALTVPSLIFMPLL